MSWASGCRRGLRERFGMLVLCMLAATAAIGAEPDIGSPRLRVLSAALETGGREGRESTLVRFWEEIEASGTPLIEPTGDDGWMSVTFLWREEHDRDMINVGVIAEVSELGDKVHRLTRLADTDVWHVTLRLETAARFTYKLVQPEGMTSDPNAFHRRDIDEVVYEHLYDPRAKVNMTAYLDARVNGSYVEGPRASRSPWFSKVISGTQPAARGETRVLRVASRVLGNSRDVAVHTPAGYAPNGGPYPFVLIFDKEYTEDFIPAMLDEMIADEVIPPVVIILVSHIDGYHRSAELPYNPDFARFVATELVPRIRAEYRITRDPRGSVIAGCSYGGIGSATIASQYPKVFGNVLSQSGSYWWNPQGDLRSDPERLVGSLGWFPRQFATAARQPLRFYIDAGVWERGYLVQANRQFRDILQARGYDVVYREHAGNHCGVGTLSMLPVGLISLIGTEHGRRQIEGP